MTNFPAPVKGFEGERFYCPRCHNVALEAQKDRRFFTLCFVPLVPVSFAKHLTCGVCSHRQRVDDAQLAQLRAQVDAGQAPGGPPPSGYPQQQQQYQQYQPMAAQGAAKQGYGQGGYPQQPQQAQQHPYNGEYAAPPPQYKQ